MGARRERYAANMAKKHAEARFLRFPLVVRTKQKSIADIVQNIYKLNNKMVVVCKTNCGKQYDGCCRRQ